MGSWGRILSFLPHRHTDDKGALTLSGQDPGHTHTPLDGDQITRWGRGEDGLWDGALKSSII